jgi:transcriptional regulator with XRE-family HTH domain
MVFDKHIFGNMLYTLRKENNLKQSDVSHKLKIHQTTYSKIELGKADITVEQLVTLAALYNASPSWLIGENLDKNFTPDELLEIEKFKQYLISIRKVP